MGRPAEPAVPVPMPEKDKLSYALGMTIADPIKREHMDFDVDAFAAALKDALGGKPARVTEAELRGLSIGKNIKQDQLDLDLDTMINAMKDVLGEKPTRFTETELKETMTQFTKALQTYVPEKNKAKGEAYLAENAKAPGVTTLADGLQYKVLKVGTGEKPKATDRVTVNYKGTLIDGTIFDARDGFVTKVTGQTIKGWSEILTLMPVGSKWQVTVPAELGYGPRPQGRTIGGNSVLIFDMELVSILPPEPEKPAAPPPAAPPITPAHTMITTNLPPQPPGATTTPVVSGQIIRVPSADEIKKGAKIEVITNAPNSQ